MKTQIWDRLNDNERCERVFTHALAQALIALAILLTVSWVWSLIPLEGKGQMPISALIVLAIAAASGLLLATLSCEFSWVPHEHPLAPMREPLRLAGKCAGFSALVATMLLDCSLLFTFFYGAILGAVGVSLVRRRVAESYKDKDFLFWLFLGTITAAGLSTLIELGWLALLGAHVPTFSMFGHAAGPKVLGCGLFAGGYYQVWHLRSAIEVTLRGTLPR